MTEKPTYINLTKHKMLLSDGTLLEPSEKPINVNVSLQYYSDKQRGEIQSICLTKTDTSELDEFLKSKPQKVKNTYYVVNNQVLHALRTDHKYYGHKYKDIVTPVYGTEDKDWSGSVPIITHFVKDFFPNYPNGVYCLLDKLIITKQEIQHLKSEIWSKK